MSEKSGVALWVFREGREKMFERAKKRLKERENRYIRAIIGVDEAPQVEITEPRFGGSQLGISLEEIFELREREKPEDKRLLKKTVDVFIPVEKYQISWSEEGKQKKEPIPREVWLLVKVEPELEDILSVIKEMRGYKECGIPILATHEKIPDRIREPFENAGIIPYHVPRGEIPDWKSGQKRLR